MSGELHGVIVAPGERLDQRVETRAPYVVEVNGVKVATTVGMVSQREGKSVFIPLKGVYVPEPGHIIIGLVESIGVSSWGVDIGSPYQATLSAQDFLGRPFNPAVDDLSRFLRVGDYVRAKVVAFDKTRSPLLSVQGEGLGRIISGVIVEVSPAKIPRVIGKKRSMVEALEAKTGCSVFPAVNGRVHIDCPSRELEVIAVLAVKLIDREAHRVGLTEKVIRFIEDERKARGV